MEQQIVVLLAVAIFWVDFLDRAHGQQRVAQGAGGSCAIRRRSVGCLHKEQQLVAF